MRKAQNQSQELANKAGESVDQAQASVDQQGWVDRAQDWLDLAQDLIDDVCIVYILCMAIYGCGFGCNFPKMIYIKSITLKTQFACFHNLWFLVILILKCMCNCLVQMNCD